MTRVSYIVSEYVCLTRGRAGACFVTFITIYNSGKIIYLLLIHPFQVAD